METTAATNHVASGEGISAVSSLPTSPSLQGTSGTVSNNNITCIARELYIAAVKGNFQEFINIQNLENLLTPNKNTILHIHLTSTTQTTQNFRMWRRINNKQTWQPRGNPPVSEEFVNQILDKCAGLVLLPNAKGETLLHIAARYGHSNIAKLLLDRVKAFPPDIENGIRAEIKFIRATNNEKDTALHEAVRYEHIGVVKTLLELDPDCSSYANNANQTPLYLASERQNQRMVRRILNKVQSPAYDGPNSQTALHAAVINQDAVMAEDLLKNEHVRLAVKQADKGGWVPLHYAVNVGNEDLTELLLKQDGNTAYMQDNEGRTALHIAAYRGFADIMIMIMNDYPDCSELVDNKGKNALHYSVSGSRLATANIIMLNLWLSNLYNEKDVDGNTPLHHLVNSGISSSRLIFHRRVDKAAVNKKYQTALDVAYGNVDESHILFSNLQVQHLLQQAEHRALSDDQGPPPKITLDHVTVSFARSGGPGGQNVNKVNTKVDMRFNVKNAYWLSDRVRDKILQMEKNRINKDGELVISSTKTRTQKGNIEDALAKLQDRTNKNYVLSREASQSQCCQENIL